MTESEQKLAALIIREAASRMGNAGCNDTESEWTDLFTDDELADLHMRMQQWDDQDGEGGVYHSRRSPAPDFVYARYLASLLDPREAK